MTHEPVEIGNEREIPGGWAFELRVGDRSAPCTLRLSWADYDLWSADGADPPHAVALAVARFVLSRITAADLPETVEASTMRRRFADADQEIPKLIGARDH